MAPRRVILRRTSGSMPPVIETREATPDEIRQLQAVFMRRLAALARGHAEQAFFIALPSRWFARKDSGFLAEFKRLGRRAERLLRDEAHRLEAERSK